MKASELFSLPLGLVVLSAAFPSAGFAQLTVLDASLAKVERFVQDGPSSVAADGWDFRALISFDDEPEGAVTVESPSTGPFTLGVDSIDPDARSGNFSFADKASLDADFPSGVTYTFIYDSGSTHPLDLEADDYPAIDAPMFTPATYDGAQTIDPTQPFTLGFEDRNSAEFNFIGITYSEGAERYPIDVVGDSATGYTIDPGDLPADSSIRINIGYTKITEDGADGESGYILETSLPATTLIPEPASAVWLMGGFALGAALLRRRVFVRRIG
ncbi:MAG: hypothetical protein ACLFSZ_03675 [Puniceicoccaceae bacterium]